MADSSIIVLVKICIGSLPNEAVTNRRAACVSSGNGACRRLEISYNVDSSSIHEKIIDPYFFHVRVMLLF